MMAVNEMAVEAYRQERCRKAKIQNSLDEDRFEKPLLDNKSPAEAFISGHDLDNEMLSPSGTQGRIVEGRLQPELSRARDSTCFTMLTGAETDSSELGSFLC